VDDVKRGREGENGSRILLPRNACIYVMFGCVMKRKKAGVETGFI
jgi:hypothetical protein